MPEPEPEPALTRSVSRTWHYNVWIYSDVKVSYKMFQHDLESNNQKITASAVRELNDIKYSCFNFKL